MAGGVGGVGGTRESSVVNTRQVRTEFFSPVEAQTYPTVFFTFCTLTRLRIAALAVITNQIHYNYSYNIKMKK